MAQHWRKHFKFLIMENKEQDRALQTPSEANRDKHMNYAAAEDNDDATNDNNDVEERRKKHDADSGNDSSTNQMLQQEELIDPGNEHTDRSRGNDANRSPKYDADAGGDGTGTAGPNPDK